MITPNSVLLLKSQISEDGEDKYEKLLKDNKFEVRQVKTLVFNFKNIQELREKLKNSSKYSGLILSSLRCVEAVHLASGENNYLEQWKSKDNFVVGEASHRIALEKLALDCFGKDTGSAENLTKVILERKSKYTKPFLFPHGNLKRDTINLGLEKEGLAIDGVEVYETVANPNIEADFAKVTDNFLSVSEYVVFFSPSGFHSSLELIKRVPVNLKQIKLIAIGPTTEMAIADKGFEAYAVAKHPNPEGLLSAILNE